MIKKYFFAIFFLSFFLIAFPAHAQDESVKARVSRVLEEKTITRENGSTAVQQNVELIPLSGYHKGESLVYYGIGEIDVMSSQRYQAGDLVFLDIDQDDSGSQQIYITDFVREYSLLWLLIIFIVVVILVSGKTGWRSLLALLASFFLIMKFLAPTILAGYNPVLIGLISTFFILSALIYLTEGWYRKSHIAVLSIFVSLLITIFLAWIFVGGAQLSGTASEDTIFLTGANVKAIDFKALLLAAIIIGTLGVLDDIAIGQIEAVDQLLEANPGQSRKKLFSAAMSIGRAHLGAIINTLFLAYAGASLPLILLFHIKSEPFLSFSQVINHEEIATEIVRTLVGAIGLCLTMPIATILAVWLLYGRNRYHSS